MAFSVKAWLDRFGSGGSYDQPTDTGDVPDTPVDAAGLRNMETRLSAYTDSTVTAHTGDTSAAHAASAISFTPTGTIAATDAQAAVAEVASEAASNLTTGLAGKADLTGGHVPVAQLGSGTPASGKYVDGASGAWLSLPAQSGSGAILAWATGTAYAQGQTVTNSGHTYTANDAHTAGATFAGDLASHWTLLPVTKADVGLSNVDNTADASKPVSTAQAAADALALAKASNLSDLANAGTARTNLGLGTAAVIALDTDGTLATNSDARVPSQKAVKTYVAAHALGTVTKRVRMPIAADGSNGSFELPDWSQRIRFQVPFTITRMRFVIANKSSYDNTLYPGAQTIDMFIGQATYSASGAVWPGTLQAAPTRLLPQFVTNADGSDFTTDWITTNLPSPRRDYVLSIGATCAAGVFVVSGGNGSYLTFGAGAAASAATATPVGSVGSKASVLDIRMEVEFETPSAGGMLVGAFIGDSITYGATSSSTLFGTFTHETYPGLAGLRNGFAWINLGVGGVRAQDFAAATTNWRWARNDWTTTVPDFAVLTCAYNDLDGSDTASNIKGYYATIMAALRAKGIEQIFLGTIIPGNLSGGKETERLALNAWIGEIPLGAAGVFDFDKELRLEAAPATVDADYMVSYPHPTRRGYQRMGSIITVGRG